MKLYHSVLVIFLSLAFIGCSTGTQGPKLETPKDTLNAYVQAIKKKDTATMKSLLSKGSIKMAQDQAKAQNISVDEIIKSDSLISPDQKTLKFRNEKTEGDNATIEVENQFGSFDKIPFIKEDGAWKIAKEKVMDDLQKQADEDERRLNDQINQGRQN